MDFPNEIDGHRIDFEPKEILDLRTENEDRNALRERARGRIRNKTNDRTHSRESHDAQHPSGHDSGQIKTGEATGLQNTISDDDEGAGRSGNLHPRAAQYCNDESANNRGKK